MREVEDQSAITGEKDVGPPRRRYLCWICGDRPFNARHQFLDHIEGAGGGGKSHLKMRKRWIEANQPLREDWLEMLEKSEPKVDESTSFTDATERPPGPATPADVQSEADWKDAGDQHPNSTVPSEQYWHPQYCSSQPYVDCWQPDCWDVYAYTGWQWQ